LVVSDDADLKVLGANGDAAESCSLRWRGLEQVRSSADQAVCFQCGDGEFLRGHAARLVPLRLRKDRPSELVAIGARLFETSETRKA
jgi:hypothetical protein